MSKPMIQAVDDLAEGVYMASGDDMTAQGDGCYTTTAYIHQWPETGRDDYRIQVDAHHNADHNSKSQQLEISFNQPVTFKSCNASGASLAGGNGTNTLLINLTYWNNHTDNIGFGDFVVESDAGLSITGVVMHDTGKQY